MKSKLYYDLMEIIEKQEDIICRQNKTIFSLVNENMEKENMINEMANQEKYLY